MSGRCKDCRHARTAAFFKPAGAFAECRSPKIVEDCGGLFEDDQLVYEYAESGRFFVGPMFGCVHFEERADTL